MSNIEELRLRLEDAERRFGLKSAKNNQYSVRLVQLVEQEFADAQIFKQQAAVICIRIPARIPALRDADSKTNGMNLLSHGKTLIPLRGPSGYPKQP